LDAGGEVVELTKAGGEVVIVICSTCLRGRDGGRRVGAWTHPPKNPERGFKKKKNSSTCEVLTHDSRKV